MVSGPTPIPGVTPVPGSANPPPVPSSPFQDKIRRKLAKWLFYEVAFALLPLGFAWKERMVRGEEADWFAILGRGELLLVSVAIVAAGIGELISNGMHS